MTKPAGDPKLSARPAGSANVMRWEHVRASSTASILGPLGSVAPSCSASRPKCSAASMASDSPGASKIEFQDSPATDRMKVEGRALSKQGASPQ